MLVDINAVNNPWEPSLDTQGLPLENGEDYLVTFRAKASEAGKHLHLQFGELISYDPWFINFKEGQNEFRALTTEWVEYSYSFTMTIDNLNGGPIFEFGNIPNFDEGTPGLLGTVWIDDIEVRGGSGVDTVAPAINGADNVT